MSQTFPSPYWSMNFHLWVILSVMLQELLMPFPGSARAVPNEILKFGYRCLPDTRKIWVPLGTRKIWEIGYRWVPGTEQIFEVGYRWVPGTEQILEVWYRWVPVTAQILEVGYRWVLGTVIHEPPMNIFLTWQNASFEYFSSGSSLAKVRVIKRFHDNKLYYSILLSIINWRNSA